MLQRAEKTGQNW